MDEKVKGKLIIIGGAEDKKDECTILKKLIELSGGNKANIVILTIATEHPEETGREYTEIFNSLGADKVSLLHIETREHANNHDRVKDIDNSSCIFFTGGDQLRITSLLGGTEMERVLERAYENGVIIAGTSAGASVMSETMITSGADDSAPKKCTLKMAPGLGLLREVVIDQHFAQRGRIGRLLTAIAQNPHMLGIGIDEDTAIIVTPDATFEVIGSNAATVLDGKNLLHTNVSELNPDEILALTHITMHVLPKGYKYNMKLREPIIRR